MNGEKRYTLLQAVLSKFKENDITLNSDTFFELINISDSGLIRVCKLLNIDTE